MSNMIQTEFTDQLITKYPIVYKIWCDSITDHDFLKVINFKRREFDDAGLTIYYPSYYEYEEVLIFIEKNKHMHEFWLL